MKAKTVLIALANLTVFCGCTDQEWHETTSILDNQSRHKVTITYYENGNINPEFNQLLNVNETKVVLVDSDTGKGRGFTYDTSIAEFDSAVVVFDNSRRVVHYGYNKTGPNPNAITFFDPRNIFNLDSYSERIVLETEKREEREVTYTFTEQDYIDAE